MKTKIISIIKKLIVPLMGTTFFILSYLIPKKKGLYIFGSVDGKQFSGNSKALFLYLLKNGYDKNKVFYITKNRKLIKENIPNIVYLLSFKGLWLFLRAEYIFVDLTMYSVFFLEYQLGNFNVITLWHGEGPKKIILHMRYLKKHPLKKLFIKLFYKYIVKFITVSSEYSIKNFNSATNTNNAVITGLARNDIFFNKKLVFFKIKKLLKIEHFSKVILYAPTWRDSNLNYKYFSDVELEKINKFCKDNNFIFIIKVHPYAKFFLNKVFSNIKVLNNFTYDIQELLNISDILITDYSSIYVDFLLTNKPILFYTPDYEKFIKEDRDFYIEYDKIIIKKWLSKNFSEFFNQLKKVSIQKKYQIPKEYTKIKNFFHKYQDGKSCKRILDKIKVN